MSREALNQKMLEMQDDIILSIQESMRIPSVKGAPEEGAPYGAECKAALDHALELGRKLGFETGNAGNQMGWIEYGEGEEMVGVLGHLDVVPAGEGWEHPAYGAEIHDGELWGRGVIDDKGPSIGAIYALKAIKDLGLPIDRRIRILLGTDEESGHHCAKYYVDNGYEMPTLGFTPDAEFPAIFYEKGISRYHIGLKNPEKGNIEIESFEGGTVVNVVTPYCKLVVNGEINVNPVSDRVKVTVENGKTIVEAEGIGAHGSMPHLGINAAVLVLESVKDNDFGGSFQKYIDCVLGKLGSETDGTSLGIASTDEDTGSTSVNLGVVKYAEDEMFFTIDIRYPASITGDAIDTSVREKAAECGLEILNASLTKCNHVPKDSELIQKLMSVYREETGDFESEALSIGGGTYAKEFNNMVAYGPLFPGDPELIHQPNERMEISKLMKALQITAGAMYELAKK